ncbi:MAG: disulfide bond formation protein B [Pseudomonadota bacterium]|uniref:disulfide bond formation protein B n=1 Tax=Roseovarius TaxID=74030 RepID=UPI0022A738D7|nr:disulfide bond formation protein B [Roseovarius sp. EGI FJ00037]MCZ0810814.1 disulfide bond formation protein B [Roseovarius sp. EGI FJ00037]
MTLDRHLLILIASGGSALMMLGALGFQYIGAMPPCDLCYWQRYPHIAAIGIGAAALLLPRAAVFPLAILGALAALTTAAIGFYHTGVERAWWDGPASCTASGVSGLSSDQLYDQIMAAPLVRCDEVPWEMFGLSMASWNSVASLILAALWIMAVRRA